MKNMIAIVILFTTINAISAVDEIKVTCNPQVGTVWLNPKSKVETSGTSESQYVMPARKSFPNQRADRLSIEEIKTLTTRDDEGGEFLNGKKVDREFPLLTFARTDQKSIQTIDEVLTFSNIQNSKSELAAGNYLKLSGYKTWYGNENNVKIIILGVLYRNGQPQLGHSITLSVNDPKNVIETVQHPLIVQSEFATQQFFATTDLKGFDSLEQLTKIISPFYEAMGNGTATSLTLDCSFQE